MIFALLGFPPEASSYAHNVDEIFLLILALSVLLVIGLFGMLLFFCIRYRAGSSAPRSRERINSTPIEITWMIIPLLIFLVFFALAGVQYGKMYSPPARSMQIDVVGKQWMWKIQHADGQREIDALHIPVGQDVTITLSSEDVVHSFYVPAFRIKHDAVPGTYNSFWFRAVKAGTYPLFCSQYCGKDHSLMIGQVIAMAPKDFATWQQRGQPAGDLAAQGEALFHEVGCSGCHALNSTFHAPLLDGLYGKPVALEGGQIVVADRQYLRDSILLPQKQIAAGFAPIMPTYQGQLSEEQVNELVAYLMSLANKPGTPPNNAQP
jgi:cytochrome c oxidase subunit 2